MSQQTQLGPIFPALRVYPIIDDIHRLYSNKMCTWNVQTFQMDMHSGLVHLFTRDRHHNSLLHLAASQRRPDIYGLLLAYGVKPDHGKHGGVWDSISGYEVLNAPAKPYELLTIDTYRLLWADYEGSPQLLDYIREGGPCWTEELRWSSVGVWLFQQSPTQLYGLELTEFQHAVLRGMLVNFIWDTNFEGLRWLGEIPRTSARILLAEEICNGSFGLLDRFFNDPRLVRPQTIGATIISALSILKIDIEACIMQELLQFPLGVIECTGGRLGKKITFTKQCTSGYTLDWVWIFDRFAPGYLLLQELPSLTADSDCELPSHYGCLGGMCDGPFSANRHDRAKILPNTGEEKWPPRFESRRARKERKERARSGQKLTRPKMPGSWVF